jgi:hypothetical protein
MEELFTPTGLPSSLRNRSSCAPPVRWIPSRKTGDPLRGTGPTPSPTERKEVVLVDNSSALEDQGFSVFVTSVDYLTEAERESEADVPVPDRLLPRSVSLRLVGKLKLSQKVGILIWLNREGLITLGGRERLLYLQAKASFEALEAGLKFARRLTSDKKLRSDFKHQMRELNRRPQSRRFRQSEPRRIGVGYRDKGTLPERSHSARRSTQEEAFIPSHLVPPLLRESIRLVYPAFLTEDGEWVDLTKVPGSFGTQVSASRVRPLLRPL